MYYELLYPQFQSIEDLKFNKKCKRLSFVKPQNVIKDKKIINEKLWKEAMKYFNDMDNKRTPLDKIKSFNKGFQIIQNSITFCTGKDELGEIL